MFPVLALGEGRVVLKEYNKRVASFDKTNRQKWMKIIVKERILVSKSSTPPTEEGPRGFGTTGPFISFLSLLLSLS